MFINNSFSVSNVAGGTIACSRNVICATGSPGFSSHGGVSLFSARATRIDGNYIGVASSGAQVRGNTDNGIYLLNSTNTAISGSTAAERNIISGNRYGIQQVSCSASNSILRNYIGTDATGAANPGNIFEGVLIAGASYTTIGSVGAGNIISGNGEGIYVAGDASPGARIVANLIGVGASGTNNLGNINTGIRIEQRRHAGRRHESW